MSEQSPRKVLIAGVHGQLGRAVAKACTDRGIDCEGRDIDTLDIGEAAAVTGWIASSRPSDLINCAAYTAVDDCETDEQAALKVNGTAVGHLASACNAVNARLVQISTDYVFAGDGDRPYREDDRVAPISAYGRTKLRGEELAFGARRHLVVRTAWLYGHGGRNFVGTIRGQLEGGADRLRVVDDQRGSPTFCDDLAEAILELMGKDTDGVFHAVNSGETTWHGFAVAIADILGAQVEISKVTSKEFPRPAARPGYSVLDTTKMTRVLGHPMPPWRDALVRYLESSCAS
jgi:dTDP-4-dehydrorhamnose reductase